MLTPRLASVSLLLLLALTAPAAGWTRSVEAARTADGHTLRFLRLRGGEQPLLLIHGLGSNAQEFLVPGRSLAEHLAGQGFDVWCLNLRGSGRGPLRSDGDGEHDFDTLVVEDVPAAVGRVRAATGRRPFLVGHSLGGMISLAWLQGVERTPSGRIVAEPALAARRAAHVRGVVAIGSPGRFGDRNALLSWLAASRPADLAMRLPGPLPGRRATDLLTDELPRLPLVGRVCERLVDEATAGIGAGPLIGQLARPGSMDRATLRACVDLAIDDVPRPLLRQFGAGIRAGDLCEARPGEPGRPAYSYADGVWRVRAPVLWVAGRHDALADPEGIEAAVGAMTVADRSYLLTDHGHVDLVLGDSAPADVWAPVTEWLRARSPR